jgi:hypothetical protein
VEKVALAQQDSYTKYLQSLKRKKSERNRDKKKPITKSAKEELTSEIKRLRKAIKNLVKDNDRLKVKLQKYENKRKNNSKVLPK